ncbi:MAG: helix-hairpin-helix domain-containing protein [Phycisphaerales bacterium]
MSRRRAFATVMVFSTIIIASVIVTVLQASALGQATLGREALARTRAYWAARAGVESTIARLEYDTQNDDHSSAYTVTDDMAAVAIGTMNGASFHVMHSDAGNVVDGPADAHAKLNINSVTKDQLLLLEPFMAEDTADSILDWIDTDEDVRPLGAELGYYQSLPHPYEPRNGPMRSITELELVAGADPRDVRGEDWNLNGVLDANENDGNASYPSDNSNGVLDAGWSGLLTASSREGTLSNSGQERLDLSSTDEGTLSTRLTVSRDQAKAILDYVAAVPRATLANFITTDLNTLAAQADAATGSAGGGRGATQRARVPALTTTQLGALLDEATIGPPVAGPGKLNINSCSADTLQYIPQLDAETADAIIAERSSRAMGFTGLADLLSVPNISRRQLATIYTLLGIRSNVYVVTSRGRDDHTGIEVEIVATVDRSTLPVVIQEVRVR